MLLSALLMASASVMGRQPTSETATSGVTGIHHVSLSVRNLDRAVLSYTQTIGLTEVSRYRLTDGVPVEKKSGIGHVDRNVVLLRGPNGQIELAQFDRAADKPVCAMPVQGPGITHVSYQAPVASGLYAKPKAVGVGANWEAETNGGRRRFSGFQTQRLHDRAGHRARRWTQHSSDVKTAHHEDIYDCEVPLAFQERTHRL